MILVMNPPQTHNIAKAQHSEVSESTGVFELAELIIKKDPEVASNVLLLLIVIVFISAVFDWGGQQLKVFLGAIADYNTKNWERIEVFNDQVEKALIEVNASMLFVVRCHNGGGVPQPGCQTFSTITNRFGEGSTSEVWTSFPHDHVMTSLVSKLIREHTIIVRTSKLKASDLKRTYTEDGVTYSISCLLSKKGKEIFYLTANFTEPFDLEAAHTKADSLRIRSGAIAKMLGSPKYDIPAVSGFLSLFSNS